MSEYIERGALIEWLDKVDGIIADGTVEAPTIYKQVITDIKQFPAADVVEVKHGEWIKHDCLTNDGTGNYTVKVGEIWVCSVCGQDEKYREPYCHCGAKMDGGCREG